MNVSWMVIRGSGFVGFGLLAASAMLGLIASSKLLERRVSVKRLTLLHESASLGALLATAGHLVALALDEYVEFGISALLVPGAATWQPLPVAFGVVAMWGAVVVSASFYLRTHLGTRVWRAIHFGSFGVFVAALVHGVTAGTDSGNPVALGLYVSSAAGVVVLTAARLVLFRAPPSKRASGTVPAATPARGREEAAAPSSS